jgi:hypothetical protein
VASKEERDARLDELATATTEWATKRRNQLQAQVAFSKALLKGRTGAERLNNKSVETASNLLVDEIEQFLTGA